MPAVVASLAIYACLHIQNMSIKVKHKSDDITAGTYMFKVSNENAKTIWKICSKLTIKTPEGCHLRSSGTFIC